MEKTRDVNGLPTIRWNGYDWIMRPKWGEVHEDFPYAWYGSDGISIKNGNFDLKILRNEAIIGKKSIPIEVSQVECVTAFKYGTFTWVASIPKGKWLWPALWLASDYSWPPEIDVMEGWSEGNENYIKRLFFKNIHPTMHWSGEKDKSHKHDEKFNIWRWTLNAPGCSKTDKYSCTWTPDYVDVFYNDKLIKRFNNPEFLRQLNQDEVYMHPIMDLHCKTRYVNAGYDAISMKVYDFKYKEL